MESNMDHRHAQSIIIAPEVQIILHIQFSNAQRKFMNFLVARKLEYPRECICMYTRGVTRTTDRQRGPNTLPPEFSLAEAHSRGKVQDT